MQYHRGHEHLVKLSSLLQSHGDPILSKRSTLCLTATSLVFLNNCFEIVNSGQQGVSKEATEQIGCSDTHKEAILFLLDFLRKTPTLRVIIPMNIFSLFASYLLGQLVYGMLCWYALQ